MTLYSQYSNYSYIINSDFLLSFKASPFTDQQISIFPLVPLKKNDLIDVGVDLN